MQYKLAEKTEGRQWIRFAANMTHHTTYVGTWCEQSRTTLDNFFFIWQIWAEFIVTKVHIYHWTWEKILNYPHDFPITILITKNDRNHRRIYLRSTVVVWEGFRNLSVTLGNFRRPNVSASSSLRQQCNWIMEVRIYGECKTLQEMKPLISINTLNMVSSLRSLFRDLSKIYFLRVQSHVSVFTRRKAEIMRVKEIHRSTTLFLSHDFLLYAA